MIETINITKIAALAWYLSNKLKIYEKTFFVKTSPQTRTFRDRS